MLSGKIIQKFTKKFEDINKNSQEGEAKIKQQEAFHQNTLNKTENEWNQKYEKKTFKQPDPNDINIRFFQKQKKQGSRQKSNDENRIKRTDQVKKDILEKIRGKSSNKTTNQEKASDIKQALNQTRSKSRHDQNSKIGEKVDNQICLKRNLKNSSSSSEQNKQAKDSKIAQKNNRHDKVFILVNKLKKTYLESDMDQLIKNCANQLKIPKHKFAIQLQGYKILFQLEEQIEKLPNKASQKQISRRFARKLLTYVQANLKEKRYKFLQVCRVVFQGLNLNNFRANAWLDKFVNQNKSYLKGINLKQYEGNGLSLMKQKKTEQAHQKSHNTQKQKSKLGQSTQKFDDQQRKQTKNMVTRSRDQDKNFPGNRQSLKISQIVEDFNDQIQMEHDLNLEQLKNKSEIKEQKKLNKQKQKKETVKNINARVSDGTFVQATQILKQDGKIKQKSIEINPRVSQIENEKQKIQEYARAKAKRSEKLIVSEDKFIQNSLSERYPEEFCKKVARKLDAIFQQLFKKVLKQQCAQLCLQKSVLTKMLEKYGSFSFKNKDSIQNQSIPSEIVAYCSSLQHQEPEQGSKSHKNSQNQGKSIQKYLAYKPILQSFEGERPQDRSYVSQQYHQQQVNPESLLQNRLNYFIANSMRCTQDEIKSEAIRIATSHPDVRGRISQKQLAIWIHNFIQNYKDSLYTQKVSKYLEKQSIGYSQGNSLKNSQLFSSSKVFSDTPYLSSSRVFGPTRNIVQQAEKKNSSSSFLKNQK